MRTLDRTSRRPLYDQLSDLIHEEIKLGIRKEGDKIDSVRQLSDKYSVSVFTAHRTIASLVRRGLLRPEKGRGTYVADSKPQAKSSRQKTIAFLPAYSLKTMKETVFFARLLQGLFEASSNVGKNFLCITPRNGQPGASPTSIDELDTSDTHGVIALSYNPQDLLSLHQLPVPVVVADYDMTYAGLDSVVFDNKSATYELAQLLLSRDCQRIGYVGFGRRNAAGRHEISDPAVWERHAGLKHAILENGLPEFADQFLVMDMVVEDEAARIVEKIAKAPIRPQALICFTDVIAVQLAVEFEKQNILPGKDILLAGFGCTIPDSQAMRHLAANVESDELEMAQQCVDALMHRVANMSAETVKHIIPMKVQPVEVP